MTLPDIETLTPFLSALAVAIPLGWVIIRGASFFPLHLRLWRLSHRKTDVSAPWLDAAIKERMELMKCRALVMWADSHPQALRMAAWATAHGVDAGTLGECRGYFDREKLELSDKIPRFIVAQGVLGGLAYFACLGIVAGALIVAKDEARFSFKADGRPLLMTATTARTPDTPRYLAMTPDDCKTGKDPAEFGADRADVCDVFTDGHLAAAVAANVRSQRMFGWALGVISTFLIIGFYFIGRSIRAANAVRDQVERHRATDGVGQASGDPSPRAPGGSSGGSP